MTVEDQVNALREKLGDRIDIHDCTICGFWCGYVFVGDRVFYDNECACSSYSHPPEPRELQELYEFLEMNPTWTERKLAESSK
jgi:hypothetical protein